MAQDIGLLLRGLGAAFSNTVPQFRQEMAQEQEAQYLQGQRQQQAQMRNAEMLQARQAAMYKDAESALKLMAMGDLDGVVALGQERLQLLGNFPDADPSDTARLTQFAMQARAGDRQAYNNLSRELLGTVQRGLAMGVLTPPEVKQPEIIPGSSVVDGQVLTRDAQGNIVATRPRGFEAAPKPAPQRRIVRDSYGVDRYEDTGQVVINLEDLVPKSQFGAAAQAPVTQQPTNQIVPSQQPSVQGQQPTIDQAQQPALGQPQSGQTQLQPGEPAYFAALPPNILEDERQKRRTAERQLTESQQKTALDLRSKFETLDPVTLYETRLGQMQTIVSAVEPSFTPSEELLFNIEQGIAPASAGEAASDISLIFAFMKMLDPNSVVREGEFATAQNSGGIEEKIRNTYNQAVSGEFLTPEQREDFVRRAYRIYRGSENQYSNAINRQIATAKDFGVPERLTYFDLRPENQFNIDNVIQTLRAQNEAQPQEQSFAERFNAWRKR